MRILCLDVGDRRIGVAVSDELGITAQGVTTIDRTELKSDLEKLGGVIEEYRPVEIVVGLPYTMDGEIGPQAEKVMEFIEEIKRSFNLPVIPWDERLSTKAAEKVLLEADVSRKKRKRVIDKLAAVMILQTYLASRDRGEEWRLTIED